MDIINKTQKPLSVPLPGGKKLFLGPNQTGQVAQKALKHPGLMKLLEAGDIETTEVGNSTTEEASDNSGTTSSGSRQSSAGAKHHSGGDR